MHGSMLWQELVLLPEGERASVSCCFSFIDMRGRSGKPVAIGGRVASFRAIERRGEVLGVICSILERNVGDSIRLAEGITLNSKWEGR